MQVANTGDEHGTIQGWEQNAKGNWHQRISTQQANVGYNGVQPGAIRTNYDGYTPEGTYSLTFSFGIYGNPGAHLPYRQVDSDDYWAGDPADKWTYNLFQDGHPASARWSPSSHTAEHLVDEWPAYRYAINIDWNLPSNVRAGAHGGRVALHPASTRAGFAIFLHTFGVTGPNGYTLGCVAIDPGQLASVLRWLRPNMHPKIVIGTTANITRQ